MNILLQVEAKAVKNASSLLHFSGHSELETGLLPVFCSANKFQKIAGVNSFLSFTVMSTERSKQICPVKLS